MKTKQSYKKHSEAMRKSKGIGLRIAWMIVNKYYKVLNEEKNKNQLTIKF